MAEQTRMHFLLFYDYVPDVPDVPDVLERRAPLRAALARGELILGGALAEPVDSAVLLFDCESVRVVEDFVRSDPYVQQGLVTRWRIRPWTTVVGDGAKTPIAT